MIMWGKNLNWNLLDVAELVKMGLEAASVRAGKFAVMEISVEQRELILETAAYLVI
jgi:hypothetical protein